MPALMLQSPFRIIWLQLDWTYATHPAVLFDGGHLRSSVCDSSAKPRFKITKRFLVNDEVGLTDECQLWVFDNLRLTDEVYVLESLHDLVPWEEFVRHHPVSVSRGTANTEGRSHKRLPNDFVEALQLEFPWLTAADLGLPCKGSGSRTHGSGQSGSGSRAHGDAGGAASSKEV